MFESNPGQGKTNSMPNTLSMHYKPTDGVPSRPILVWILWALHFSKAMFFLSIIMKTLCTALHFFVISAT